MGKPIVDSVEDALGVFFLSGVDALVIGDRLIRKTDGDRGTIVPETRAPA
jgi:predicted NodU family carbamoyl transferase